MGDNNTAKCNDLESALDMLKKMGGAGNGGGNGDGGGSNNAGILEAIDGMKTSLRREFDDKLADQRSSLQAKANLLENDLLKRCEDLEKAAAKMDEKIKNQVQDNALIIADHMDKIEVL